MKYILPLITILFLSACDESTPCTFKVGDIVTTKTGIEKAMVENSWGQGGSQCSYGLSYVDKFGVHHYNTFIGIELDKKADGTK